METALLDGSQLQRAAMLLVAGASYAAACPSCSSDSSVGAAVPREAGVSGPAGGGDGAAAASGAGGARGGASAGDGSLGAGGARSGASARDGSMGAGGGRDDGSRGVSDSGSDAASGTRLPALPPGSASVPVGWYTAGWQRADSSSDSYFASLSDAGVNFLVTNQPPSESGDPGFKALLAYLDKAGAHGIRVVVGIPVDALVDTDAKLGKLRAFFTAVKDHPALFGYGVDEPDGGSVSATQMAAAYSVLKSIDSRHPLEAKLLNSGYEPYCDFSGQAPAYSPYMDLGGRDVYPIVPNDDPTKYNYYPLNPPSEEFTIAVPKEPHGANGAFLATLIADDCATEAKAQKKLPPIIDLQGVGTAAGYRDPTYLETRYMLFTTVIRDVSGVAFWVDYRAFGTPVQATVDSVIKEVAVVGGYLELGTYRDPAVGVSEPKIGYRVAEHGKTMVIVAVNESEKGDQPLSGTLPSPPPTFPAVTFTLPAGQVSTGVDLVLDGFDGVTYGARSVPVSTDAQGRFRFTDAFSPYAVHIYDVHL